MNIIDFKLDLGDDAIPIQPLWESSATQKYPLGASFQDEWGNKFRYAQNGAVAIIAGCFVQNAILGGATTTLQSQTVVAAATNIGDTRIFINGITTAQAVGLYNNGFAGISITTGATHTYTRRIKFSSAIAITGGTSFIDLYEPLHVALTTSDRIALQINPYRNIIVAPTTATGAILGGIHGNISIAHYCWVQSKGWFAFRVKDVTTNIGPGPVIRAGTTVGTGITGVEVDTLGAYREIIGMSTALWLDEGAGFIYLTCE